MKNKEERNTIHLHLYTNPKSSEISGLSEFAENYLADFLTVKDYGDIIPITFRIYVEKEMNFHKQDDGVITVYPKGVFLNIHFKYDDFLDLDRESKENLVLTSMLNLLKHWSENLRIPKGTELRPVIENFEKKLIADNKLTTDLYNKLAIKLVNPFRIIISAFETESRYVNKQDVKLFDDIDIERFFNNRFYDKNFGECVKGLVFSYDIFDFENPLHIEKFKDNQNCLKMDRQKRLCFMYQYDLNKFIYDENYCDQTLKGQVEHFHEGMILALDRVHEMKRKPKDLDLDKLKKTLDEIFIEFEREL